MSADTEIVEVGAVFVTGAEAVRRARIPMSRLLKIALTGDVGTYVRPGKPVLYNAEDLDRWILEQQAEAQY